MESGDVSNKGLENFTSYLKPDCWNQPNGTLVCWLVV